MKTFRRKTELWVFFNFTSIEGRNAFYLTLFDILKTLFTFQWTLDVYINKVEQKHYIW